MSVPAVAQVSPPQPGPGPTYTIGELAREFDLTTRATRIYTVRDRTRLKLTLRGKRLGLTLAEVKELVDMYETPRDTQPQLKKFLVVLATHRLQLEQQLADLQVTLGEVREQEREARRLLAEGRSARGSAESGRGA